MIRLAVALAALALSTPAWAQGPADAPVPPTVAEATATGAPEKVEAAAPEEKRICRIERPTGSRMGVRVCRTKAEIAGRQSSARDRQMKLETRGARPYGAVNAAQPGAIR